MARGATNLALPQLRRPCCRTASPCVLVAWAVAHVARASCRSVCRQWPAGASWQRASHGALESPVATRVAWTPRCRRGATLAWHPCSARARSMRHAGASAHPTAWEGELHHGAGGKWQLSTLGTADSAGAVDFCPLCKFVFSQIRGAGSLNSTCSRRTARVRRRRSVRTAAARHDIVAKPLQIKERMPQ